MSKWDSNINEKQPLHKEEKAADYGAVNAFGIIKHKYPIAVFFVLATKFFEAFAANGIRTVLALFLYDDLNFSENLATITLHIFNFFGQFCPIIGAILADSYMGNVSTISAFSLLYGSGWILLLLTTLPGLGLALTSVVSVALMLIAIGNGSVRACVTSLGALQFKVPEQALQLAEYFSNYYVVYYLGIFLSKLLPPLVRAQTQCFNKSDCYPAVFGMLTVSFALATAIFFMGKYYYKAEKLANENILLKFFSCIRHALILRWKNRNSTIKKYWLHYAIGRYEPDFINDVRKLLQLWKLFLPLLIYFALLAQQDSSWTFQATMLNTTVAGITIEPDQAKSVGPVFLFALIPFWRFICLPLIKKIFGCELRPLQSLVVGGILSAISFICAGVLEQQIYLHPFKQISILWQMPQFMLIMMGEVLLSIPGLQFAFEQAPKSMKVVVTAAWFINNAFGNLFVVIMTELNLFSSQSALYFFYAVAMFVATIIFKLVAYFYELQEQLGQNFATSNAPLEGLPLLVNAQAQEDLLPTTSLSAQ